MRSLGTAIGAGALLVALAGCATSQPSVEPAAGPALTTERPSPTPAPDQPTFDSPVPEGGKEVPPAKVDAALLPEQLPRTVWTEGDGSVLGVIGQEGGCSKASVEVAEQTSTKVKLVLVETVPKEEKMCTMDIRFPPLTAKIDAPLGDRQVVLAHRQDKK
ncbi:hypothetical protein GCM10022243_16970 [Saccharothrix violaceirubra]|uniref:Uncharacterized protein n=1 Tax=Saccharothrix violaceirubra TaxID=413306 RepID=A0A7W7T6S3_9PSEU|nr:hypothetical protein [Saccharothrix violaceirubra]MBB4967614.1 hypothetical protein [Saccharothrix violaceirubra]